MFIGLSVVTVSSHARRPFSSCEEDSVHLQCDYDKSFHVHWLLSIAF